MTLPYTALQAATYSQSSHQVDYTKLRATSYKKHTMPITQPLTLSPIWYYGYMKYVFSEPSHYDFRDVNGHHGKFFGVESALTNHLIIECEERLTVSLIQHESEFTYYILEGEGYFIINDQTLSVVRGDLVVIPPNTKYTFGGKLRMLLSNTPRYTPEQEEVIEE